MASSDKGKLSSVEEINKDPQRLNGLSLKNGALKGLAIKNASINNLTLENIDASLSDIENVTFKNCLFRKVKFDSSKFENVAFENCILKNDGNVDELENRTTFYYAIFNNVIFDSTEFHYIDFQSSESTGGFVLFRNIRTAKPISEKGVLINLINAKVRIDNCMFGSGIIGGDNNTNTIVKNSTFNGTGLNAGRIFISNSKMIEESSIEAKKLLVITDSTVSGGIEIDDQAYLVANSYSYSIKTFPMDGEKFTKGVGLRGKPDANIYVMGKPGELSSFRMLGGNMTFQGLTMVEPLISQIFDTDPPITSVNLRGIVFKGGRWEDLTLLGGKWENVTIEPNVTVKNTSVQNIQAYNLQFPKGEPWKKNGKFTFEVTKSPTPFEWKEIKAPTPEELGLVWWPEVEPGYHPK